MFLGRSPALWVSVLQAALNVAVVVFHVPLDAVQVGTLNAFGVVVVGLLANQADPRALPVLAPTTSERRNGGDPLAAPVGGGRRSTDGPSVQEIQRRIEQAGRDQED